MALFKILKGNSATLPSNKVDGYCYVTIDEHKMYVDYNDAGTIKRFALNAVEADKLKTARTITLSGDVSGYVSFDGSKDVTITTTVADNSHNHTITAASNHDSVVVLTGTNGTNKVTYKASHAKKGPASGYTSGNTTTSISGSGASKTIKIPQLTVDAYGHVTTAADEDVTITMPTIPNLSGGSAAAADATVVGGVTVSGHAVTVGKKTLTAGANVSITGAADKITIASTNTDTKVTAVGNHYTPAADANAVLSVDASSTTKATWNNTSLVTGVNIQRDAKGHVTGVTVDSVKMPSNPNIDTKVTQTLTSSNAAYPLLLAPANQGATATTTTYFDSGVTLNPSTNTIAANISGTATKATQDGSGNVITSKYVTLDTAQTISGAKTFTGRMILLNSADAEVTTENSGVLLIGPPTGEHISIDGNEIMAKSTGTTAGTLNLQVNNGGTTMVGGILTVVGNATFQGNIAPAANNNKTLGTNSYKWNNVYATTFTGDLSGNASSASLLKPTDNINTITYAKSGWAANVGEGKIVWRESFKNSSLGNDTGDIILWLNNSTWLNMTIDGEYYAKGSALVLHSGNYNNYAPTKTGTGASGTWGISISGNAATASKVYLTATNPSTYTAYRIPFTTTSTGNGSLLDNDGFAYHANEGTTSTVGTALLVLGNATASGTAGNKRGGIAMYGTHNQNTILYPSNSNTAQTKIYLPSKSGTLALTSDITASNSASATKLQTARTLTIGATGKTFDGSANVSWTPYEMRVTRAQYDVGSNMNQVADHGCELGMANLSGKDTTINPGGGTSWHHYINMTWSNAKDNDGSITNEWCTQIANKCGTTDLWVRSRSGGEITDGTAWAAPWTRILTGSNYTSVLDSRYINVSETVNASSVSHTNYGTNGNYVPTMNFLSYWNGAYASSGASNLTYCKHGAFGTMATKSASSYLPLSGGTMTGAITSSLSTGTHLAGNKGTAIINSTSAGKGYTILAKMNSTNGVFTLGEWQTKIELFYTANSIITAGTNSYSSKVTLLAEDGTSRFNKLYGAVWNDYAEYRACKEEFKPGQVVYENGDDTLSISNSRLQRGCSIVSDTFGFAIGETDEAKCPIAVSGRVLAYGYEPREEFKKHIGCPVCSGPNGTVSIMTEEEEEKYPSRIIGIISAIPDYEEWGTENIKVDNRIWIKVK